MNSLSELNSYVTSLSFEYEDQRYTRVIFDRETASNQTKIVNEGETFPLSIGIEITDIVNYVQANATMTVNITSAYGDGVRLNWGTLPAGVNLVTDGLGLYTLSGISSVAVWNQIKQPSVVLPTNVPNAFYGNWTYTVSISYYDAVLGNQTKTFTVAVSVLNVTLMTTPIEFVYDSNTTELITNTPQLAAYLDTDYPGATWTITATVSTGVSIDSFSSSSTGGGTFTFNSGTKGFTIVGTRSQVNSHLANLSLDSNDVEVDFVIYYVLSNNQTSTTDSKNQAMTNRSIQYFSNLTQSTFYYTEDTKSEITGYSQITDNSYSGSGDYTVRIYASTSSYIYTLESEGAGGNSEFDSTTKTLIIRGSKTEVNNHLVNVSIQPASDVDATFQLFYELTTPINAQSIKIMTMICSSNDQEVSNISLTRSYTGNTGNSIFATNTPQITDFDSTGPDTYTIVLQSALGVFSDNDITYSNPYSFSGTRAQVNAKYASIKLYPNKGVSTNGTITYTQIKNSTTQLIVDFAINGTAGTYQGVRNIDFSVTSTFTPTIEDALYGKWSAYIIGAGGGGGRGGGLGGGGGAGETIYVYDKTFTVTTYNAVVGVGGLGGNSPGANGGDGTNSSFGGFTARAGKGGKSSANGGHGGNSGIGYQGGTGPGGGGAGNGVGFNGGLPANGNAGPAGRGGNDYWFYTYRDGSSRGPTGDPSAGGGGGGSNTNDGGLGGDTSATSSGRGASTTYAARSGYYSSGTTQDYTAGIGGGGGSAQFQDGGNGSDGWIRLEIYY